MSPKEFQRFCAPACGYAPGTRNSPERLSVGCTSELRRVEGVPWCYPSPESLLAFGIKRAVCRGQLKSAGSSLCRSSLLVWPDTFWALFSNFASLQHFCRLSKKPSTPEFKICFDSCAVLVDLAKDSSAYQSFDYDVQTEGGNALREVRLHNLVRLVLNADTGRGYKNPKNLVDGINVRSTRQILTVLLSRRANDTVLFVLSTF